MTKEDFRKEYLYSVVLAIAGMIMAVFAIMFFIFSSFNSNEKDVIFNFLEYGVIAIVGVVSFLIGVIWNIMLSFKIGNAIGHLWLGWITTFGWLSFVFIPVLGWLGIIVILIYGWVSGSKE